MLPFVVQIGYSQMETFAARMYADTPTRVAHIEDIPSLPDSGWVPVGTVEFCRAAMAHQGIPEPDPIDYPDCLEIYCAQGHRLGQYGDLPGGWSPEHHKGIHAKPVRTKLDESLWSPDTPFWIGLWHRLGPEYRVYVCRGEILGIARYDDREDGPNDPLPLDMDVVRAMVATYQNAGAPAGYGLDVGVSDQDGRTLLVEVNDGWALGLYKGMPGRKYLQLLAARWEELLEIRKSS